MAELGPKQKIVPIELQRSVDMSAVERDVVPWDEQNLVLQNSGICREGGVTNLGAKVGINTDYEESFYCKNGSLVQLKRDTTNRCFHVFSNTRELGIVPEWGVKSRDLIPSNCCDVQATIDGTLLLLFFSPGYATIEEIDPDTNERLNVRSFALPAAITNIWFVRYKQPTYATVKSICGYGITGTLTLTLTAYIITDAGATAFSNTIGFSPVAPYIFYIACHYEHGWIIEVDSWPTIAAINLWLVKTDLTYTAPFSVGEPAKGIVADYKIADGSITYKTFVDQLAYGGTLTYGAVFTPPATDGAAWATTLLSTASLSYVSAQKLIFGGYATSTTSPFDICYFNFKTVRFYDNTYNPDLPEIYGNLWPELIDFALKIHSIDGNGAYLSASFNIDGIGAPITEIGELNPNYCPQALQIDSSTYWIMYQRGDMKFCKIEISKAAYLRMQEISPGVVKINCTSGLNIADSIKNDLQMGGNPFNGFVIISFSGSNIGAWVARHRGSYGGSVDVGYKNNTAVMAGTILSIALPENIQYSPNNEYIDIYAGLPPSSLTYRQSMVGGVAYGVNAILLGTIYVDDQVLPIPAKAIINERSAKLVATTALREADYDGYQLANEIAGQHNSFVLYGRVYFVDTDWIRGIAITPGNVISSADKITPVTGLTFVTASPQEAFFTSEFDNALFSFSGGQTIDKKALFNRREPIVDGIYSVGENTLALLNDARVVFIRDGIITETDLPFATPPDLFSTVDGIWLSQGGYAIRYIFNVSSIIAPGPTPDTIDGGIWGTVYADTIDGGLIGSGYDDILDGGVWGSGGDTIVDLLWQSKFLGFSDRAIQNIDRFLIRLYKEDGLEADITITYEYLTERIQYLETRYYTVGDVTNPWDSEGYGFIEYIPTQKRSVAASIKIECATKILILAVYAHVLSDGITAVTNR